MLKRLSSVIQTEDNNRGHLLGSPGTHCNSFHRFPFRVKIHPSRGNDWKHRVTLTEIAPCNEEDAKDDAVAAYLVSGENACPPEDVGGVQGYAGALQSFNDPEDGEYEHIRQWMGEDFDPCFFDIRGARRRVDDFQRIIGEARWGFYRQ